MDRVGRPIEWRSPKSSVSVEERRESRVSRYCGSGNGSLRQRSCSVCQVIRSGDHSPAVWIPESALSSCARPCGQRRFLASEKLAGNRRNGPHPPATQSLNRPIAKSSTRATFARCLDTWHGVASVTACPCSSSFGLCGLLAVSVSWSATEHDEITELRGESGSDHPPRVLAKKLGVIEAIFSAVLSKVKSCERRKPRCMSSRSPACARSPCGAARGSRYQAKSRAGREGPKLPTTRATGAGGAGGSCQHTYRDAST